MLGLESTEIVACAPRLPGDWRSLASMVAFVLLAFLWAPARSRRRGAAPPSPFSMSMGRPSSGPRD